MLSQDNDIVADKDTVVKLCSWCGIMMCGMRMMSCVEDVAVR